MKEKSLPRMVHSWPVACILRDMWLAVREAISYGYNRKRNITCVTEIPKFNCVLRTFLPYANWRRKMLKFPHISDLFSTHKYIAGIFTLENISFNPSQIVF
jgi:hypothetical protein